MIKALVNKLNIKLRLVLKGKCTVVFKNGQVYHLRVNQQDFFWSDWFTQMGGDIVTIYQP